MAGSVDPDFLDIKGSTQPELFQGTVDEMIQQLKTDAGTFWQTSLAQDGEMEIWEINGERFLYNGNHRYQAAKQAGVEIPVNIIKIVDKTGSQIPTFLLEDLVWLPGRK